MRLPYMAAVIRWELDTGVLRLMNVIRMRGLVQENKTWPLEKLRIKQSGRKMLEIFRKKKR